MSFLSDFKPVIDDLRGLPNDFGIRQFTVTVTVRQWTGERAGIGTSTDVVRTLKVAHGNAPVKVEQVSQKEILASGGVYADRDLKVGPFTPEYPGGGVAVSKIDPIMRDAAQEILWLVTGPGLPDGGVSCDKINTYASDNFTEIVVLRANGSKP